MGLDIACREPDEETDFVSERVGSYSGVQRLRRDAVNVTISYLRARMHAIDEFMSRHDPIPASTALPTTTSFSTPSKAATVTSSSSAAAAALPIQAPTTAVAACASAPPPPSTSAAAAAAASASDARKLERLSTDTLVPITAEMPPHPAGWIPHSTTLTDAEPDSGSDSDTNGDPKRVKRSRASATAHRHVAETSPVLGGGATNVTATATATVATPAKSKPTSTSAAVPKETSAAATAATAATAETATTAKRAHSADKETPASARRKRKLVDREQIRQLKDDTRDEIHLSGGEYLVRNTKGDLFSNSDDFLTFTDGSDNAAYVKEWSWDKWPTHATVGGLVDYLKTRQTLHGSAHWERRTIKEVVHELIPLWDGSVDAQIKIRQIQIDALKDSEWVADRRTRWSKLITHLGTWVSTGYAPIEYKHIESTRPDELVEEGLVGLYHWVQHSDCDGTWSSGEALDICLWWDRVKHFAESKEQLELHDVVELFRTASKSGAYAYGC